MPKKVKPKAAKTRDTSAAPEPESPGQGPIPPVSASRTPDPTSLNNDPNARLGEIWFSQHRGLPASAVITPRPCDPPPPGQSPSTPVSVPRPPSVLSFNSEEAMSDSPPPPPSHGAKITEPRVEVPLPASPKLTPKLEPDEPPLFTPISPLAEWTNPGCSPSPQSPTRLSLGQRLAQVWSACESGPAPPSDESPIRAPSEHLTPQPAPDAAPTEAPTDTDRHFSYGSKVRIVVRGVGFQAVSGYLTQRSTFFQERLKEPSRRGEKITLELNCDPTDFEHYLEVLHFGPIETGGFLASPASESKVTKLLAVAEMGNKYGDLGLGSWALQLALPMCAPTLASPTVIERLVRIVTFWPDEASTEAADSSAALRDITREIVTKAMQDRSLSAAEIIGHIILPASADPTRMDTLLLGSAYYHLLQGNHTVWASDQRLDATHRRRLLCGHIALAAAWDNYLGRYYGIEPTSCLRSKVESRLDHGSPCALLDRILALADVMAVHGFPRADLAECEQVERKTLWKYFDTTQWGV